MKKNFISIFISLIFVIFLSGCGGGNNIISFDTSEPTVDATNIIPNFKSRLPLGTNLSSIGYNFGTSLFVDVFKSSQPWFSVNTIDFKRNNLSLDLDSNGWVRSLNANQAAATKIFSDSATYFPAGKYIVLYEGTGEIIYSGAAEKITSESTENRDVLNVDNNNPMGILIYIKNTKSNDYIKNIKVIIPGGNCKTKNSLFFAETQNQCKKPNIFTSFEKTYTAEPFHPLILKQLYPYTTLRYMDLMRTLHSEQTEWSDRAHVEDATWDRIDYSNTKFSKGVPLEILVDLANKLESSPWFNIPHKANDDYVRNFATLIKQRLHPDLKFYIEYSNEVWNGNYSQSLYAQQQGLALKLITNPNTTDVNQLQLARDRYYSLRSRQIFKIFEEVFGGTERFTRVLSTQSVSTKITNNILNFQNPTPKTIEADALAIAPYLQLNKITTPLKNEDDVKAFVARSNTELFSKLDTNLVQTKTEIENQLNIAKQYNLKLITYEGGQHLVPGELWNGKSPELASKLLELNRDARMKDIYKKYLEIWYSQPEKTLFCHFSHVRRPTGFGAFGSLESIFQKRVNAPKYDALMSFIETNSQ